MLIKALVCVETTLAFQLTSPVELIVTKLISTQEQLIDISSNIHAVKATKATPEKAVPSKSAKTRKAKPEKAVA